MPLPGGDFKKVREAILDAYSNDDLRITLRETMDVRIDHVVAPGPFGERVFELLEWSERQGREVELIQAAAKSRPRNAKLQEVYAAYGMAVPVEIVQRGTAFADGATTPGSAGFERTVNNHIPFFDIAVLRDQIQTVENRVCQVTFKGAAQGTGFLVGPDAVLTNYHVMQAVLNGGRPASEVECVFDFKKLSDGTKTQTPVGLHATAWNLDSSPFTDGEEKGRPDETLPTAEQLDYALIRLARPVGSEPWAASPSATSAPRGWLALPKAVPVIASPAGIIIAQHPKGWPMKIGIDTHAIDEAGVPPLWYNGNKTRLRYATNTEGGSSGSPVFDMNWKLVALHHYGDPAEGHPAEWNQGIPIVLIRERIQRAGKVAFLGDAT